MSIVQIVIRTIVTTVDLLLTLTVIKVNGIDEGAVRAIAIVVLLNLMGVWI